MSKSLLYILAVAAVVWYIGKLVGIWVVLAIAAVALIFLLWNKRPMLITVKANQAYFGAGDAEKGEELFEKAYNTGRMPDNCKIMYSSFCLRENQYEKGRSLLNEVIASHRATREDKNNARHNLAVLMWKEGNIDEALAMLKKVHKESPVTGTYGTLGVLYLEKAKQSREYSEALKFMLEAYDYNASDKTIADNLGELYLVMGEYEKAKEVYEELLVQELVTPMPYYNYGLVLRNMGDTDGARENFEKALNCRFTSVLTVTKEMVEKELESLN